MTQNAYLSISKYSLLILIFFFVSYSSQAQFGDKRVGSRMSDFLKTQWWLGLRVGTNVSQPDPVSRYTSIDPIDYDVADLAKTYSSFEDPGILIGLDITFYHKGLSFGIQPSYKQMKYGYYSDLTWMGDTPEEQFDTRYDIKQSLSYLELPVVLKYELIQQGKVRPFVMGGMHYSFILDANKNTEITQTDYSSGQPRIYHGGSVSLNTKSQFQNYYGAIGGIGTGFDFFNIRSVLEITYHYGLSSLSDPGSRFEVTDLTTLGEVNDEINLNQIQVTLSFVFPLRYIDNTFQPY